jgi:hypothetical protein
MDRGEDEFLWWQRRAILALCAFVLLYGLFIKPILLLTLPLLLFASLVAVSRILRDQKGSRNG